MKYLRIGWVVLPFTHRSPEGLYQGTGAALLANAGENAILFACYGTCQKIVSHTLGLDSQQQLRSVPVWKPLSMYFFIDHWARGYLLLIKMVVAFCTAVIKMCVYGECFFRNTKTHACTPSQVSHMHACVKRHVMRSFMTFRNDWHWYVMNANVPQNTSIQVDLKTQMPYVHHLEIHAHIHACLCMYTCMRVQYLFLSSFI